MPAYRFSPFEVNASQRRLLAHGLPVPLGARALDLLIALIDRRERVVGKGELLELVWPGLVVEENNLQVQVSTLRKILGADAIATVPGIGYRFTRLIDDAAAPRDRAPCSAETQAHASASAPILHRGLIGRQSDLHAVLSLLSERRLVTVAGPGGMGKTALASCVVQAWRERHQAVATWVDLANVHDGAEVIATVGQALGRRPGDDATLSDLLLALNTDQERLLVLDNAETQLRPVATLTSALLDGAANLRVLVTSQVALKVREEWLHRLGPLDLPLPDASPEDVQSCASVALFMAQASASGARLPTTPAHLTAVVDICRQLDGMPLAIKLAASRAGWLGLSRLLALLDERLRLLVSQDNDGPARQQTLQATLDWSHDLLTPAEQTLFRQLGVARGTFHLDFALGFLVEENRDRWQVLDLLGTLIDRSLVMVACADPPRYRLLESARHHACAKLEEAGELDQARHRHARAMAEWMDLAFHRYWSMPDAAWLKDHAPDLDNVRAALAWNSHHDHALAIDLAGSSVCLFMLLGLAAEARRWTSPLEAQADRGSMGSPAHGRFWIETSRLYWGISGERMLALARKGLAHHRASGHAHGIHQALRCMAGSGVLDALAMDEALHEMRRLQEVTWPARMRAQGLFAELAAATAKDLPQEALDAALSLQALAHDAGLDLMASAALSALASIHLSRGDSQAAMMAARELLAREKGVGSSFVIHAHGALAHAHLLAGCLGQARDCLKALAQSALGRESEWVGLYADLMALLAAREGRPEAAARLLGYARGTSPALRRTFTGKLDRASETLALIGGSLPERTVHALMAQGALMDGQTLCACAFD